MYKTFHDLVRAFNDGDTECTIIVDNDQVHAYRAKNPEDLYSNQGSDEERECIFSGEGPDRLFCEILDMLEIPWEMA